jgi:thioesterase domain-containing protein/acyl carrier protein
MNKNELFIESIKSNKPSSIAMVYYDGRKMSYEAISILYDSYKSFIKKHALHNTSRIGVLLEDHFYYFPIGLSVLENMSLVILEYDSDEVLKQDLDLFHLDYLLVDTLKPFYNDLDIGIIHYCDQKFEMIRVSNKPMSEYHHSNIAYLSKTSGTTSFPKIVPIEYSMLVYKQNMNIKHFGINENTIQIQTVKMSRMISLSNSLRVISEKGCVLQTNGINVKDIVDYLRNYKVQFVVLVPAGIKLLLNYIDESNEKDLLNGITFIAGGSYLDIESASRLKAYQASVISYYGMTETGSIASSYHAPKDYKEASVGIAKLECKIIDHEICVRGEAVFKGYENQSNEDVFIDGWFKTGDIGWMDEDQYIYITGRKNEMINRSGEKVSPYEIETLLKNHEAIEEVVVFPSEFERGIEEVACAVVLKENYTLSLKELRFYLKDKINSIKMPTIYYCVKMIPISDKDKFQRKTLDQYFKDNHILPEIIKEKDIQIYNSIQKQLIKIYKQVLNQNSIELDDDFFDCGGDSLKVNELIVLIEKQFNVEIPVELFLQNRNVRQLSKMIDKKYERKTKYLVKLNQIEDKTPIVCVHSGDGVAINYHYLAKELENYMPVYAIELKTKYARELSEFSLENLVKCYLDEIQEVIDRSFVLLGDCLGGLLAFELAYQAKLRGMNVEHLIMLDTPQRVAPVMKAGFGTQVLSKVKRNVKKLEGLSLRDRMNHSIISLNKMVIFIKSWIEKEFIRIFKNDQLNKIMKFLNHRTIIRIMVKKYQVPFYPDKLIYVQSIENIKVNKHLDFWKNHAKDLDSYVFECKHDEFLNRKEVKELVDLIKQNIQTVE